MKIANIAEADSERTYEVEIPFEVSNGDGKPHEEKLVVTYRALTPEITRVRDVAAQLARVIVSWSAEEEPTFDFLSGRPLPFLQKIADAIGGDFLRG